MTIPKTPGAMRMTPARYAAFASTWPGGRTVVTNRAGLDAALAAGQPVTVSTGAVITGAALDLPAGADVRSATYLGANLNFDVRATDVSNVTVAGFRLGSGFRVTMSGVTRGFALWCLAGGGDRAFEWLTCSGSVSLGNIAQNCLTYGHYHAFWGGGEPNVLAHARWSNITHTPPRLAFNEEIGVFWATAGVVSSFEGSGSGYAEMHVITRNIDGSLMPTTIENGRLDGRIGIDLYANEQLTIRRVRARAVVAGIMTPDPTVITVLHSLRGSLIEDVMLDGGAFGLDLETPDNPTIRRVTAYGQTGASIKQKAGALQLDLASCDLQPAPSGTPFLFVP